LAKLPLDPRVGRMILAAKREGCLNEILIVASVLSIQDPRERPMDKREAADNAHAKFAGEGSDFMSYLKLWDFFDNALKTKKSNKDLLNQCHSNFLSFLRLKEWRELHRQLLEIVLEMDFKLNEKEVQDKEKFEQIHKSLLAGLLGNIGFKDGDSESYAGARGIRFHIAPGSTLKKTRPKWVIAAELVDTTKLYARCVAKIEPDWIEPIANPNGSRGLTESQYTDPRWDRKMGMVNAWERVSLYGLTIIPKRRVHYGLINPQQSREIFIREALANGEFDTNAAFFTANERLIAEVEELEHKARRQDVLVDEHQLFAFYDAKIPADIFQAATFEQWREDAEKLNPKLLYLTRDDLMRHGADAITAVQFPEKITLDGMEITLKYRFEPGHMLDGVTATIPLALLNQLNPVQTEWLVPGMLREKLTYLIKALPKTFRRVCVPVPEFVTKFLGENKVGEAPIKQALAAHIQLVTTLKIGIDDWVEETPAHLLMNFSVVDDAGRELAMGRDWNVLKKQLGSAAQLTFRNTLPDIEKTDLKQWDFGDLPEKLSFERDGIKVTGYPALEDNADSISVKLFDTQYAAHANHRKGVCRLMRFELKEQIKQLEKSLPNFNQYALILRNVMSPEELREDMVAAIADRAFIGEDDLPRTNADFMKLKQRARTRLPAVAQAIARQAQAIANEYQLLAVAQAKMPATVNRLKRDLEQQVALLVYKHCFTQTPWEHLQHVPRYLKALRLRIEKQPSAPERDGKNAASVGLIWQKWQDKVNQCQQSHREVPQNLQDFRWLIEELRVSLFAQELKTPMPISIKRLDKTWAEIG
ncbi:MAG: ATP-dependent RNA helicase HrpA, partial [Pseudomonadota bacterium]